MRCWCEVLPRALHSQLAYLSGELGGQGRIGLVSRGIVVTMH